MRKAERNEGAVRLPRWPVLTSFAAACSVLVIAAGVLFDLRANVEARARESAANLLQVIERDVARNIEILDLSLRAVVEGTGRADIMAAPPELRRLILFDRSGTASGLGAFVVFDAAGRVAIDAASTVPRAIAPVVDRDYFQAQTERDAGLFISRPYLSRLIGKPVIGFSRRIGKADGSFDGVALATIQTSYFTDLLDRLRLGPGAIVTIAREDGAVLVRHGRSSQDVTATDLSNSPVFQRIRAEGSGSFTAVSALDGRERMYAFTRIGERPLVLTVAQATDDVFSEWRSKAILLGLVLAVIGSIIVALTVVLTRELRRRAAAESGLARLNEELARLSTTDALTGLCNRRAFDDALLREGGRARRTGERLALVLADVDHFKRFNDRYGHQQGDHVLKAVADAIASSCGRPGDRAFRVGGEEFAVLLHATGLDGATEVAERIRATVRGLDRPHSEAPLGVVTISLGVAEIGGQDPQAAFAEADAALYLAKRNGRDRVTAGRSLRPAAVAA